MTSHWNIAYGPRVKRWLNGFPARIARVNQESRSEAVIKAIERQYATVERCRVRANQKKNAFYNLLLSCEKLNELLCSAETSISKYRTNAGYTGPIYEEEDDDYS